MNGINTTRQQLAALSEFEEYRSPDGKTNEQIPYNGGTLYVTYRDKEALAPLFGRAVGSFHGCEEGYASVRQDLSPRVKNFVRNHELFHLLDNSGAGGTLGRELRANLIPGLRDPIGLMATIKATIQDKERVEMYRKMIFGF